MEIDLPTKEELKSLKRIAFGIAKEEHDKGDPRWDGTPYISHPIAVSQLVDTDEEKIVALLHDVIEDCKGFDPHALDQFGGRIVFALHLMTKMENYSYPEYLRSIKGFELARKVKIADLRHNLSDLHKYPKKKHLREKYEASLLYLEDV